MTRDVEARLAETLERHAQAVQALPDPVHDLEHRIHARSQRRTSTIIAAAAAGTVVALATGALLAAGPGAPRHAAHPDAPSDTVSAPIAGPTPSAGTGGLVPAESDRPTVGACEPALSKVVVVSLEPDGPAPRCVQVTAGQRLRVVNATSAYGGPGRPATVQFADFPPRTLGIGEATLFKRPVGDFLALGVHTVHTDLYGSGGTAVWLRPAEVTSSRSAGGVRVAISTHCGVRGAWVDGDLWLASPPLGGHNPPAGWDENQVLGLFVIKAPGRAEFHGDDGEKARFRLAERGTTDPNAGCE